MTIQPLRPIGIAPTLAEISPDHGAFPKASDIAGLEIGQRLPDWYEPVFDPSHALARALLILDALALRRGVRLYPQWDYRGLKAVVGAGREAGFDTILASQADPDCCRLANDNAFWILGVDADGRPATTQTGRYYDWTGTTLRREVESFRFFYDRPQRHLDRTCWCEMPPSAEQVTGPTAHSGTIWVRPDLRGPDAEGIILSRLLGRITRLIAISLWAPRWLFTFSLLSLHKRGVVGNFGWDNWGPGARWQLAGQAPYDGGLAWMSTESFVRWASELTPDELTLPAARGTSRVAPARS